MRRVLVRDSGKRSARGRIRLHARDGISTRASEQANSRATPRIARSPRARTRSRKDGNGSDSPTSGSTRIGRPSAGRSRGSSRHLRQQLSHCNDQFSGIRRQSHQDVSTAELALVDAEPFPDHTLEAVTINGARNDAPRNDEAKARAPERVRPRLYRHASTPHARARREQHVDVFAAESLFAGVALRAAQTTPRRTRPLARRARITARPPRVRIRTRNPCVRFRRSTEGWKVRFIERFPQGRQNFVLDDFCPTRVNECTSISGCSPVDNYSGNR
jgi:hypothetical protein